MTQNAQKLKGFRDYLPAQAALRRRIIAKLYEKAERSGFLPIDTPAIEYAETLLGQGGDETDKEVYQFMDHGERQVALRFDLTVPFARFVAENLNDLPMPFKKVQAGEVWRGEKPQKGRYRQFCQADVDIIGAETLEADVEVLSLLAGTLVEIMGDPGLGIPVEKRRLTLAIGHRVLLSRLIKTLLPKLPVAEENKALIALDKLVKIGPEKVTQLITGLPGADEGGAAKLVQFLTVKDPQGNSDLKQLAALLPADAKEELARFEETLQILRTLLSSQQASVSSANGGILVTADLSIARGLGYYTGIVFETFLQALPGFGSVSSGGRYNDLVSRFSSQKLPGVGGSIGVDRLLAAVEELQVSSAKRRGIFVALATADARAYGFEIANALRAAGFLADITVKPGKLGNQFKFADRRQYSHVITVGSDELQSRVFAVKDLALGQEEKGVPVQDLLPTMRRLMS